MNEEGEIIRRPTYSNHMSLPVEPKTAKEKVQHFLKAVWPSNVYSQCAILVSFLQMIVISALEISISVSHSQLIGTLREISGILPDLTMPNARALSLYHVIFVFAAIFQFYLVFDAVLHSSMMQTIAALMFMVGMFGYSVIQFVQAETLLSKEQALILSQYPLFTFHPTRGLEIGTIVAMILFVLVFGYLTTKLYRVFGWRIFKGLGADAKILKKLRLYHIFILLLKLNIFFFLGFSIQYLVLVLGNADRITVILHASVAIPVTVMVLVLGFVSVVKESRVLLTVFLVGMSVGIGYMISKLVDIFTTEDTLKYKNSKHSLTVFITATLVVCVSNFVVALLNLQSFGKGLIPQFRKQMRLRPRTEELMKPSASEETL